MKRFILLTLLFFSACQPQTPDVQSQNDEFNPSANNAESLASENALISADGIGKAKLGMTIGQLKAVSDADTKFEVISPFIQDVHAIAVSKNDIVQYYILCNLENNEDAKTVNSTDRDKITALLTNNHNYQTREGVKVGMPIEEAEEIYGNAVLAYNRGGESREYIIFNKNNSDNIRFRASYFKLISDGLGFSGIYPEYPGVSYTTDKYRSNAAIAAIEVSCNPKVCAK